MNIKKPVAKAGLLAALALSAMLVVGCSDDGGDEGDGNENNLTPAEIEEIDNRLGAGASRLVGSWLLDGSDEERVGFVTLKSSGETCRTMLEKDGSFWIGYELCGTSFRVSGEYMYFTNDDEKTSTFSISGNILTLIHLHDNGDEWYTETYTKINDLSVFKNNLGTIHIQ